METLLLGVKALDYLEKEGFRVLKADHAVDADEAASVASAIGFPVALKILSPDVIHKTDEGGVEVCLNSEDQVKRAFRNLVDGFALRSRGKTLEGVMVQRMGVGLELIVGSLNDNQFGPVMMFGLGGIFAEAIKDVVFRLIPVEPRDVAEMMRDLQGSEVLTNPRGESIDVAGIEHFLVKFSRLIARRAEIQEMDLNPVFVSPRGIEVCDARIKVTHV